MKFDRTNHVCFKPKQMPRFEGFGLTEIVVAVTIGVACAIPLIWMVSSTRMETSKAINYLRAMELANEVLDLANVVPFDKIEGTMGVYNGRLLDTGIPVLQLPSGHDWSSFVQSSNIPYSPDYGNAFFFRDIEVEPITGKDYGRFLKRVRVTVSWNEAKTPPNPDVNTGDSQRMRKITLETLVFNDADPEY